MMAVMNLMPSTPLQSLVIVAWRRADYLVHDIVRSIGLGRLACKPFLLRPVRARLAADLARFEALTRRLLVLMVLERPLPEVRPRAASVTVPPVSRGTPAPRPYLTPPAFRLADPAPRTPTAPPPRRPKGGPRPRILRLAPLPPATRSRRVPESEREALRDIHNEACLQLALLDSS
jgi:hypothetical protein